MNDDHKHLWEPHRFYGRRDPSQWRCLCGERHLASGTESLFAKIFGGPPEFSRRSPEELDERMRTVLASLDDERERKVLMMRHGIDGEPTTLKMVGVAFGVTPERIRQIETRALRKMRHPSRSKGMYDWWASE